MNAPQIRGPSHPSPRSMESTRTTGEGSPVAKVFRKWIVILGSAAFDLERPGHQPRQLIKRTPGRIKQATATTHCQQQDRESPDVHRSPFEIGRTSARRSSRGVYLRFENRHR